MTKSLLAAFILAFVPFLSFSQTQVSGNIQKNTTWTKANSPYILSGTVGVPSAYTLTIEPGVEIQRPANSQILINGAVIINGLKSDSITFSTGNFVTAKPFIEFNKSKLDNSSIRFVRFINQNRLVYNIRIGYESSINETFPKNSGTLKVSRSSLNDGISETHGLRAAKSMDIDSCTMKNANIGVSYYSAEKINISNSTILGSAINCLYDSGITMINCNGDGTVFTGFNLKFMFCKIKNSNLNGSEAVNIENSIFLNTPIISGQLNMKNTKYIVSVKNLGVDRFMGKYYTIATNGALVQGCELIGLNSYKCMRIGSESIMAYSSISNNNFSGFDNNIDLYGNTIDTIISINNNNFYSPANYSIANLSSKDITASNNYFQLKPAQTIDDIIFDDNDDLSYGSVNYNPYSTTPVKTVPVSRPQNATKEVVNGKVIVKWSKNSETDILNYKVYRGYVDDFTYSDTITVSPADSVLVLNSASITDSIAVTASKVISSGRGNEEVVYESWFSPAVLASIILPVKLLSFDAVSLGNKTQLSWHIAREINNDHFDIEYSTDGINFTSIGSVNATVNNGNISYSFLHNTPLEGFNYYRLKQVDKDGHFEYSNVVRVRLSISNSITVYPNPAAETITIISSTGVTSACFVNKLGQEIKKVNSDNSNQLKVSIGNLPKGVYRVLITNLKQETDNVSFIKL